MIFSFEKILLQNYRSLEVFLVFYGLILLSVCPFSNGIHQKLYLDFFKDFFLKAVLNSLQKMRRYRDFPYIPPFTHIQPTPTIDISH